MQPSDGQGLNQGGPGDQAGPSSDSRDTGLAGSQQGRPKAQQQRPVPFDSGKEDDAAPALDGPARREKPATERDRQGAYGEGPTGGDPRTPNIPGT
jgi:hypothetical protein